MARRRFFVDEIHHGQAMMQGEEVKHLRQVLRAEVGQRYELSDGQRVYLAEIECFRKGEVTFRVVEELPQAPLLLDLTLYAALIKFDRFEWIVEKATELGVGRIVPVIAARTDFGLDKAAPKRLERWNRIALEAAKQCHRVGPPELTEPVPFSDAVSAAGGFRVFLDEDCQQPLLGTLPSETSRNQGDTVSLLVGPEGGWTDAERKAAVAASFAPASLGTLVLRAETAVVAAMAILQSSWHATVTANPAK
jgi:16S rRNA (uracil1498-N3)-methyltransferase